MLYSSIISPVLHVPPRYAQAEEKKGEFKYEVHQNNIIINDFNCSDKLWTR